MSLIASVYLKQPHDVTSVLSNTECCMDNGCVYILCVLNS